MSQPAKPTFIEAAETFIIVEFQPNAEINAPAYKLSWKQHPQPWSEAEIKLIHISSNSNNNKIRVEAPDLVPATTYCLRLIMVDAQGNEFGQHSPELIVDTEAVGCTPGQKSSSCCCVVQ